MECPANSVSRHALRGQILALMRLEFDRRLPALGVPVSANCEDCAISETFNPSCCGVGWAFGNSPMRPLCRLSHAEVELARHEAQALLDNAYAQFRRLRTTFRKPARV